MLYSSPCANLSCSLYSGEKSSPSGGKVVAKAPKGGKRRKDTRRICLNGLPVPISRFPLRGTPRSGKGCTRRSADMKLHCQSDRQTAACFTLVHLPGSYPPAPLRHFVALFPSRGRKGWRRSPFFHLYPIKIAFSQKFRLPIGIFLLFRKVPCM